MARQAGVHGAGMAHDGTIGTYVGPGHASFAFKRHVRVFQAGWACSQSPTGPCWAKHASSLQGPRSERPGTAAAFEATGWRKVFLRNSRDATRGRKGSEGFLEGLEDIEERRDS